MSVAERTGRVMDRLYDRIRHPAAFRIRADDAVDDNFDSLRGHTYALVVTFRRNGQPVPSPVWFGLDDDGRAFVRTVHDAGKVRRIRNDGRALIAPSNVRGKPTGLAVRSTARVLPKEEWPHAEAALAAAYGLGRKIYEGALGGPDDLTTYIEITPVSRSIGARRPAERARIVLVFDGGPAWPAGADVRSLPAWPQHAEFIDRLTAGGLVEIGGPIRGREATMVVTRFPSVDAATNAFAEDPFVTDGTFILRDAFAWRLFVVPEGLSG